MKFNRIASAAAVTLALGTSTQVQANIINGGFEDGLNGWTSVQAGDASDLVLATGTSSVYSFTIPPSPTGDTYVFTTQTGPGSSILYQPVTVTAETKKVFFDIAIYNSASDFVNNGDLDYTGASNQVARFDVLIPGASITSTNNNDIISTVYITEAGDSLLQDWQTIEVDISTELAAYLGEDIIFRFAQIDNQSVFSLALDNINLGLFQFIPLYTLADAMPSLNATSLALDSTIISTSALVNGAHSRPMSRRVAKGEKTFWLAGDWGNVDHGSQSGSTGLAEVSGGYNFGPVQVNASLGKFWGSSNLVNNGDIDSDGNYIMVEGIVPVSAAKGLYATVGTFYQSGEVDIDRAYLVSGAVEESSASPDSRTWGLRARLDWENAFAYKSARFSPYADIWHSRAKLDGYTETGGDFPARFDSRKDNITELRAGLNLALPTSAPAVEFVANIEGVHRFTSSADNTTGEIIGIGSFDLDGQDYRQNWLKGGVGLEAKIGQGKGSLMLNGTTRGEAASAWLAASYQMTF